MEEFLEVIKQILIVLFWICEVNIWYYTFLYIVGMIFHKQKYPMVEDNQKFCIFVPCHNEGPVVESTVENYTHIEYNPDLFDIYFIADNCTDDTAKILREAIRKSGKSNFHVLVRNVNDPNKRGKPHALKWAIDELEQSNHFYAYYNLMIIFDADNFVDPTILKHINSQYLSVKPKRRPVMIQCYLDSKNKKGLVARGYFTCFRVMNAFWQISKQKLHLVPGIGGTGFATSTEFLHEIGGFNCKSLTEDLEIQTIATIRNKRIEYNANARIYDEKPTKVKTAFVQKTRWAQGHWYLSLKYIPILFIQMFNPFTIRNFFKKIDCIFYLAGRIFGLLASITIVLSTFYMVSSWFVPVDPNYMPLWVTILNYFLLALSIIVVPLASLYDGTEEEKKSLWKEFIPNIISLYFISIVDLLIGWPGLFKCPNQKVWKKTTHQVVSIDKNMVHKEQTKATIHA